MPNKRMFAHDYTRVGFYMITILTAGRRPLFGACRDNLVHLSPAGKAVWRRWHEIPSHCPAIEASTLVVMPDHLHGIVYVKEQLPKPVGATIRGFKSGATSELRKLLDDPALNVWDEGYHDRVIMSSKTLRAERRYIHDNPRRYCARKAHPDLFVKVNRLDNPRLPSGMNWSGFGNLFLLEKPEWIPVQVSRRAAAAEVSALKGEIGERVSGGAVMVSPFISPGEKDITRLIMSQDFGSLVLLRPDGFPPQEEPGMVALEVKAGDAILFTENLRHGGVPNQCDEPRKTLHVGYGPYWLKSQNIATMDQDPYILDRTLARYDDAQKQLFETYDTQR